MVGMSNERHSLDDEARQDAKATTFLERHGIPAGAREFRLRQEFFRHGWDLRIRNEGEAWLARAVKPDRAEVVTQGTTEGVALRLALTGALSADETPEPE